jgi:hypothetical protein
MSNALAIAGVSAVLRDLLNDGLINHNVSGVLGSTVRVSTLPPDRVPPANGTENTQLNLFLHQVRPNTGWRNEGLPSRDSTGRQRLSNPPLALDLHYILSAYGAEDLHAEILLGYAMQLLHETAVLTREAINTALKPSPNVGTRLPPALRALADSGLADQVEQIKITPATMNTEEMSQIWSALQAHYRPTAAYQVSVVLIESRLQARSPLPVLSRGPIIDPASGRDRGVMVEPSLLAPLPTIEEIRSPNKKPVAQLGDTIDLIGHHLDGANRSVRLENLRFEVDEEIPALASGGAALMQFTLSNAPAIFPVGIYQLSTQVVRPGLRPGDISLKTSNQLALVISPEITTSFTPFPPENLSRDAQDTVTIELSCRPEVRPGQRAELILGNLAVFAEPFANATADLIFLFPNAPPAGTEHLVRLRVDGIESPIINRAATPPVFFNQRVTLP